jgi:hypothetical protein
LFLAALCVCAGARASLAAVAYAQKTVTVDNITCKLSVWDTVGQGR